MKHIRKIIYKIACKIIAFWLHVKTDLSVLQCRELSVCLINTLRIVPHMNLRFSRFIFRLIFNKISWKDFCLTEKLFKNMVHPTACGNTYREPIGRWFTIDTEQNYAETPKIQNNDHITYYASGREPFLAIANHIAPERKVVLLPYFVCDTVYQPFIENGWELVYYRVNKDLTINTADVYALFEKHKPSIAVFMEYSGMDLTDAELEIIGILKKAGCVTLVDRTQNIYSVRRDKEVDFYCGSLRKWFCCPDGAYLEKKFRHFFAACSR